MSDTTTVLYGKFFPSNGKLGTLCLKEAEMNHRKTPKFGTVLFGVYLLSHGGSNLVMKVNPQREDGTSKRLVIELSVRFNVREETDNEPTWDSMVSKSDSLWLSNMQLGKLYSFHLPSNSFFLRPKRNECIEETLNRFTRKSHAKWGGTAISYVVKSNANLATNVQVRNEVVLHDGVVEASSTRLQLLDLMDSKIKANQSSIVEKSTHALRKQYVTEQKPSLVKEEMSMAI